MSLPVYKLHLLRFSSTELATILREAHKIEDLSVAYSQARRGFYFRTAIEPAALPTVFERVER